MRRYWMLTLIVVLGLLLIRPTYYGAAQGPEPGQKVSVSVSSDSDCRANNATFTIPAGWMGTEVHLQANTQFLACTPGTGSTDRVGYSVTGPVSWSGGVERVGKEYGDRVPDILPAGTYQMQLTTHGKNDSYELTYVLQPAGCKVEEKSVSVWSDTNCIAHSAHFVVPTGCIATDIRETANPAFLQCSGPEHPDRSGYMVTGPVSWERGITWDRTNWGDPLPKTLPAGSYEMSLTFHGKMDSWELHYTLRPVGGAGATVPVPTVATVAVGKPGGVGSGKLDLIFCIDVTGSMEDDIDNVKAAAVNIVDTIARNYKGYRVAIIAYRDWNDSEGWPMFEDYAFSSDKAKIVSNIQSLSVGGGDDTPEAVFEALMRAIDSKAVGGWRAHANKQIILMGDAPPHNPSREGLTPQIVAKAAEEADPVVIQAIVVGNDGYYDQEAVDAFRELAELTHGGFFQAENADQVPDVLKKTIQDIPTASKGPGISNAKLLLLGGLLLALLALGLFVVVMLVIFSGRRRRPVAVPYAAPYQGAPSPAYRAPPQQPAPSAPGWQGQTMVAQRPAFAAQAALVVEQGPDAGQRFVLQAMNRIGRAPDNTIVLHSNQVSRHHATINNVGKGWVITDLGSVNGVVVNGTRIQQPHFLRPNDVIILGDELLRFVSQ